MPKKTLKTKEQFFSQLLKEIKSKCSEFGITLIFDKLENDGGICKYKDKTYIIINKIYDDEHRIKLFLNEISNTEFNSNFEDIKKNFVDYSSGDADATA
ncbi:hypothetical protein KA977_02165 [Candidatus Dependentiae bacterium]|nr:hypothetical protein [Candidatus Dependentiae bacterium]